MQNWKFLVELECQRELSRPWDRSKAKESSFVAPYTSPPKELVIQGLLPAPPPKPAPKRERCRDCFYYNRRERTCRIKQQMGLVLKGYCPKRFSRLNFSVRFDNERRNQLNISDEYELCRSCDFFDKVKHECLIRRVNGEGCIYIRPSNKRLERVKAIAQR